MSEDKNSNYKLRDSINMSHSKDDSMMELYDQEQSIVELSEKDRHLKTESSTSSIDENIENEIQECCLIRLCK